MRPTQTEPAVSVRGLAVHFGPLAAVDGLDLELARGEALGLLGPNGAGKTTTLRVLSTLCGRQRGEVRVLGLDPAVDGHRLRRRIGVVPQEIALYGELTARENLEFWGRVHGVARLRERVDWALGAAALSDRADDRVAAFSGGMKRRLNLVASLLHEPELLFLDEPTAGVDPQSRNHLFEFVEELRRAGLSMVYTTHQMGEVERLCDRIQILDRGRSLAVGSLDQLRALPAVQGAIGGGLQLPPDTDWNRVVEVLRAAGLGASLGNRAAGLEEIFLSLTGRALRDGGEG